MQPKHLNMKSKTMTPQKLTRLGCLLAAPALAAALLPNAAAVLIRSETFTENTPLFDGLGVGNNFTHTSSLFSDVPGATLTGLSVGLDLTGGYNGQLYAYLSHGTAGYSVLLNRVGRDTSSFGGYIDPGMNIILSDSGVGGDVHLYSPNNQPTWLTGTWMPDGRESDPETTLSSAPRTALLGSFTGEQADGAGTLYVEDVVPGQQTTLNSWTLNLQVSSTSVPEGEQWVMTALVLAGLVGFEVRRRLGGEGRGDETVKR